MKCPKCGKEITDDSLFCEYCGVKITFVLDDKVPKNHKYIWLFAIVVFCLNVFGWLLYRGYYSSTANVEESVAEEFVTKIDTLGADYTETAFGINMKMIWVEGGDFMMGCTSEQSICDDDEADVHSATVKGFYIGAFEISQKQWESVVGSNVREWSSEMDALDRVGDNYPMYNVSWGEAMEFCRLLSKETGKTYTLPTEVQWEYAARGGQNADRTMYAGSDIINVVAWYKNNSGDAIHLCGKKRANSLGIYDMSGNVWEWCKDWYKMYGQKLADTSLSPGRIIRGGSCADDAKSCRVSKREYCAPLARINNIGFRVVCIPE